MWNLRTVVMPLEKGVQFYYSSLVSLVFNVNLTTFANLLVCQSFRLPGLKPQNIDHPLRFWCIYWQTHALIFLSTSKKYKRVYESESRVFEDSFVPHNLFSLSGFFGSLI